METDEDRPPLSRAAYACLLGAVVALFLALRLWNLAAVCLDADEAFSLLAAYKDWGGMWEMAAADISHPPLFYALLKAWMFLGGDSLLWLRMLPALLSLVAIVPFLLLCRERRLGPLVTFLALFLWATNGSLIYFAQHLRNFILLQCLSIFSLWLLARHAGEREPRRRTLAALVAVNLLAVYAHYWGWVLVGTEFLVLVALRRMWLPFLVASAALLVPFAPWALAVVEAAAAKGTATAQIEWITKPGLPELLWFVAGMNGTQAFPRSTLAGLLLFGLPVGLWCLAAARGRAGEGPARSAHLVALLLLASVPAALTFAASRVLPQSVWASRQLLFSFVPYLLLVSIGVARLARGRARAAFVVALSAWSLSAGLLALRTECVKTPLDRLLATLVARENAEGGAGDVVLFADDSYFVYSVELHLTRRFGERFRHVVLKGFEDVQGDRFWVIGRDRPDRDAPPPRETLRAMGYRCGEESSVPGPVRIFVFPVHR